MTSVSPGRALQAIAVGHAGVGLVLYRDTLRDVVRSGYWDQVPDHGERAAAFWFMATAPPLWLCGRLLAEAEDSGDTAAQRVAGWTLAAYGLASAAAMPRSGFWTVVAAGAAAWRRARR